MTNQPSGGAVATPLKTTKMLSASLIGAVVVLGVVTAVLGESWDYPETWVAWVIGAVAVVAYGLCELLGYRAPAIAPGAPQAEAMRQARGVFQSHLMVRFALSELPALIALVLFFTAGTLTPLTYLIGGVLSLVLMAIHVWPGERVINRVERNLDRAGGQSHLGASLGGEAPSARLG